MARLTKKDWIEVEELYKQGWTQRQLAIKFKVRPETISLHMTKAKVKGGEKIDVVREEMQLALMRKLKEFAEKRASRQIDTKEKFHTLINSVLAFFVKELKQAQDSGAGLDKIGSSARALKEAVAGMKMAREELYTILDIKEDANLDDAPDLFVMPMTQEDEDRIRSSKAYNHDDDEVPADMSEEELAELQRMVEESEEPDAAS